VLVSLDFDAESLRLFDFGYCFVAREIQRPVRESQDGIE
jgi:hypothetical protein